MENSRNNQINFNSLLVNTELNEKLGKFKLLSEFLSSSLIYYYQTAYSTKLFTQEEYDIINDKYEQIKTIMDYALNQFKQDLKRNQISSSPDESS